MSAIKEIRRKLSLSQYQLADILGVSRALVNLAETGKREIKTEKFISLLSLSDIHVDQKAKQPLSDSYAKFQNTYTEYEKMESNKLKASADKYRARVLLDELKLDKMIKEFEQSKLWLNIIEMRLTALEEKKENEKERLGLEVQQATISSKLWQCGNIAQGKLRKKIFLLKAQIEINELLLKGMGE